MGTLQRTCTVKMPVDRAETCWNDFVAQQQQSGGQPNGDVKTGDGNPGTVYFNESGNGQTEVTMQINPQGIAEGDESTLNQRVDSYLQKFKQFVESR